MSKACYYVITNDDCFGSLTKTPSLRWAEDETIAEHHEREKEWFFHTIAHLIAFADCYDDTVDEIVWDGRPVHYTGWQPGMTIEFADDETGEIVYSGCFPEWDH